MGRPNTGGHIRTLGGNTQYRLIRLGSGPQVLEHRYVMEQHLGRKLLTTEIVHHIDGDGLNNNISNLELMSQSDHRIEHSGPFKWDLAEGLRLNKAGFTDTYIGDKLGVSQATISRCFRRRGIPAATVHTKRRKFDRDKAISLYKEGFTTAEIGKRLGVTRQAIRAVLRKNGF